MYLFLKTRDKLPAIQLSHFHIPLKKRSCEMCFVDFCSVFFVYYYSFFSSNNNGYYFTIMTAFNYRVLFYSFYRGRIYARTNHPWETPAAAPLCHPPAALPPLSPKAAHPHGPLLSTSSFGPCHCQVSAQQTAGTSPSEVQLQPRRGASNQAVHQHVLQAPFST